MQQERNGDGYCECGCGQRAPIAKVTARSRGRVKGKPMRFVHGHNRRRPSGWDAVDCGYITPCWLWRGTRNAQDYGMLKLDYRILLAHRVIYERFKGPIPGGLDLDHLCRVHACVNPDHLEPVTVRENTRRGLTAKITVATARDIHHRIVAGESQADIARSLGVSQQLVCDIKKGRRWKDAAPPECASAASKSPTAVAA